MAQTGTAAAVSGVWRDKKRYLWLMGLIAPTLIFTMLPFVWVMNQLGWHPAAQVPFWIRADPDLRAAAGTGPAVRRRRAEPARRADGAAGQ